MDFGGAGFFLFDRSGYSQRGKLFVQELIREGTVKSHIKRHRPRGVKDGETSYFALEVAIRMFSHIHLIKDMDTLYPDDLIEALTNFQNVGEFLLEYGQHPTVIERFPELSDRFVKAAPGLKAIVETEQLMALRDKSTEHHYANDLIFDGLKRFLLKFPL